MRKMDEMERSMRDTAIRFSWVVGLLLLVSYNIYQLSVDRSVGFTHMISVIMLLIALCSYTWQRQKMGEKVGLLWLVSVILFALFLLGAGYLLK